MEVSAFIAPLISGAITALISGFSVYVTLEKKIAVFETKLDALSAKQDKHNNVIERVFVCEKNIEVLNEHIRLLED